MLIRKYIPRFYKCIKITNLNYFSIKLFPLTLPQRIHHHYILRKAHKLFGKAKRKKSKSIKINFKCYLKIQKILKDHFL